jgi:hypothetical protein
LTGLWPVTEAMATPASPAAPATAATTPAAGESGETQLAPCLEVQFGEKERVVLALSTIVGSSAFFSTAGVTTAGISMTATDSGTGRAGVSASVTGRGIT